MLSTGPGTQKTLPKGQPGSCSAFLRHQSSLLGRRDSCSPNLSPPKVACSEHSLSTGAVLVLSWLCPFESPARPVPAKSHLTEENTKAERGDSTCPRSPSQDMWSWDLGPSLSDPKALLAQSLVAPETPTSCFYSNLGHSGIAIVLGFWNVLSGLQLESTRLLG